MPYPCPTQPGCDYPQGLPNLVGSSKYLAVFDAAGVFQAINIPEGRSVLIFDGSSVRFVDASDSQPFVLPQIENQEGGDLPNIIGMTAAGQFVSFTRTANAEGNQILKNIGGLIKWVQESSSESGDAFPTQGIGLLYRSAGGALSYIGDGTSRGLYYIDGNGVVTLLPTGATGNILTMTSGGVPAFVAPSSGSAQSGGGSSLSLNGVLANNTSSTAINVKTPKIVATNAGGDTYTLSSVDVTLNTSNPNGVGGLDVGSISNSAFYHYYIMSDGDGGNIGLMFSSSASAPNLTNAGLYTYYVYAGVFYVESSGVIRDFYQKSRRFYTKEIQLGTNLSVSTTYAVISGSVAMNTILPPNTTSCHGCVGGGSNETQTRHISIASNANGMQAKSPTIPGAPTSGFDGMLEHSGRFDDQLIIDPTSPTLWWKANSVITSKIRIIFDGYSI